MTATATLSSSEEVLPTFVAPNRGAGSVGGSLYKQISNTGVSPASTAADVVLAVYTLPASTLTRAANTNSPVVLDIVAAGNFAATANNKTVKIIWNATTAVVGSAVTGGTTIASTGVVAINNLGFVMEAFVGYNGSNSQYTQAVFVQAGATTVSQALSAAATATDSADILIAVTGNAATATTDIVLQYFEVSARA